MMNNKIINKYVYGFIGLLLISNLASAQEILSLQQAMEIALKNNFSIQIAKSYSDIAKNDVTFGNAGMLPQLNFSASGSIQNNKSKNINSEISLNWTLFDGMKMYATYDKLKELNLMGELQLKIEIENNVAQIIEAYYDVVQQKQLIKATSNAFTLYEEREKIAQAKLNIGSGSPLEVNQAIVDLNAQKSQLFKLQTSLYNAKANLNQLLARAPETDFIAEDSIPIAYNPKYEDLKTSVPKQNYGLMFAERNINVADYELKEIRSMRYPKLGVSTSYSFSRAQNQAGLNLPNQNPGLNAGIGITWNLFNGFEVNRQVKDLQTLKLISQTQYDMTKQQLDIKLSTAFRDYQQAKNLLILEEQNNKLALMNIEIAFENFRIGKISTLELKDVQKSLDDANIRLVNARYDAKTAETELMRLNGMLVK